MTININNALTLMPSQGAMVPCVNVFFTDNLLLHNYSVFSMGCKRTITQRSVRCAVDIIQNTLQTLSNISKVR